MIQQNGPLPNQTQLAQGKQIIDTVARGNPQALMSIARANGLPTQGQDAMATADMLYRQFAAGDFNINSLNGVQVSGRFWDDVLNTIETIGDAAGNIFGGGGNNNTPPPQPDNTDLIMGIQKSTMYLLAGIAAVVLALIVFLQYKK